ncbi:hypothetical protein K1T71_002476 [Dendrolimus kikuchii]|uniref:Uncharacterized protein n=1 Tax=Dendrolimus kikuchii TaxID=765133 RepID=A0ACC1DCT9_9NEOP|nr:hypothetical protein K1T71_002476 [Dendrolimus kikuchii]
MFCKDYNLRNPDFEKLGYVVATANLNDKHDRSAPTDYHWKILKCRMIIFSNSSILACPDKQDVKRVHIIFNKLSDDYDKLNSLFTKFCLMQNGSIQKTTPDIFKMCFEYTMTAKIAPNWNTLGTNYLINNRNFLTCNKPQDGLEYHILCNESVTTLKLKPIKIIFLRSRDEFIPGEWIRVLPSLNRATIEDRCQRLPEYGHFKSYKDLRRHWKNIHGYRLPEEECQSYYMVRFWRGDPLTYPKICILGEFPIITPVPKHTENVVLSNFIQCLKHNFSAVLGQRMIIESSMPEVSLGFPDTQEVSLCTPTLNIRKNL